MREHHPLRRLLPWVRPHARLFAASLLLRTVNLGAGVVLLGLSGAWIARGVLEGIAPDGGEIVTLVAVGLVKALARYGEQVAGHAAAFRILETLRNAIFAGMARRGVAANAADRSGDLVSRAMGDVELVEVFFAHTLAPLAAALIYVVAAGLSVGAIAGAAYGGAVVLLLLVAGLLIPLLFQRAGQPLGREVRVEAGRLGAEVAEGIAGVQDLLVAGALGRWSRRIARAGAAVTRATSRLGLQSALKDVLVDACLVASLLVVVGAAVSLDAAVEARVLAWAAVCGLAGGFGAVLSVSRAVDDLPRSAAAAERVLEIVEAPPHVAAGDATLSGEPGATAAIAFEGLTVEHAPRRGVFDVDLAVAPGTHLFVTGPSGSGKSTLAAALLGMARPLRGQVRLGGVPVHELRGEEHRRHVAAAGQAFGLVPGSLEENVALGCLGDDPIPEAAWEVPELRALLAEVSDGAATRLSGADEQLSGGQQRRIGLARLIARGPRVVVLDEAFAGLDGALRERLRRKVLDWALRAGRTVIEISHEIEDGRDADRVVVLAGGRVLEEGTCEELLAAGGTFSALADLQAGERGA